MVASAQAELIDELLAMGIGLDDVSRAADEGRLALLPSERELAGDLCYTSAELAERSGVPIEQLAAQRRASGLPTVEVDERAFGEDDLRAALAFRRFLDAGLSIDGLLDSARVFGQSAARAAAAVRTLLGQSFVHPGDSERDVAMRFATAARELHADAVLEISYLFRAHLLQQLRSDIVDQTDLATGRISATHVVGVCFVDLVGFTEIGERTTPEELGELAEKLAALANDVAEPPVRLIKTIGDAAMLVSPDPGLLVGAALALVAAVGADAELPELRAGVALGPALHRFGDWYGSVVNLADRVTGTARPGSVLVTEAVRSGCGDRFRFSRAGARRLKGMTEPVPLFRVRPPA